MRQVTLKNSRQWWTLGCAIHLTLWVGLAVQVSATEPALKKLEDGSFEVVFQHGVNGYSGTIDTEIWALAPKTILSANPNASSDANNDGGESQVLMRFEDIIGSQAKQIPAKCHVISARLIVSAFDQGSTVNLHRMLVPFEEAATWDNVISGVSADGFEASRHKDGFTFGKIAASSSGAIFDVTGTVQGWVNGQANHGWVFLNTGGNGWDFYASEFDKIEQRPKLIVRFSSPLNETREDKSVRLSRAVLSGDVQSSDEPSRDVVTNDDK